MRQAILVTRGMRPNRCLPFITPIGSTHPTLYTRPRSDHTLVDKPALLFEHTIDRLAIHAQSVLKLQLYPESAIAKRGIEFADSRAFFWLTMREFM